MFLSAVWTLLVDSDTPVQLMWESVPGVEGSVFKEGDCRVCSNYRGITLFSLQGKAYVIVLERRKRPVVSDQ